MVHVWSRVVYASRSSPSLPVRVIVRSFDPSAFVSFERAQGIRYSENETKSEILGRQFLTRIAFSLDRNSHVVVANYKSIISKEKVVQRSRND